MSELDFWKTFWNSEIDVAYSNLKSSSSGLSSNEVRSRIKLYGQNIIPDRDKREWIDILIAQFMSPLLIILLIASFLSAYLGDIFDTIIIIIIVVFTVLLGFFQEYKSERVLAELKKYFSYHTVVLRDGEKKQIDSKELVPGDIVFTGIGDIIPADLRIIETTGILVNESVLTGESREVQKSTSETKSASTPQDISNGLFMGTTVVDGYAKAIVISTGKETFFGKTAILFSQKVPESEFQVQIRKFGDMLFKIIIIMTVVVFASNYWMGHGDQNPFSDSMLFALAFAIGIAPEALPAVITICLSSGSMKLAKKNVVTKKLAAIEDLGNIDVLCTDKTGTLTEEGIYVEGYVDLDKKDSHDVFEYALLCNSAVGHVHFKGNPVDVAIMKHGHDSKIDVSRFKKLQAVPFDFERRRMSQVVSEGKSTYLISKGAPEAILSVCTKIKIDSKLYSKSQKEKTIRKMFSDYNKQGLSTIAVAYKDVSSKPNYSKNDEKDLIFMGFILLSNPPKTGVSHTLARLKALDVDLKILTGDDALVTKRLCNKVGFKINRDRIILGSELMKMSESQLSDTVEKYNVFSRIDPEQKLLIVETLKKNNHVVGFLGDGINDAPSLRTADVGISVDSAADVAKGASHIILLKRGLDVICDGVEEGRKIFGNITKYVLNTMSANQGNMITVALSSFFLPFIPLLPSQILLNNLLSDLPLLSISTDNVDKDTLKKPQRWNRKFILKFMVFFGLISTVFDLIFISVLYFVMGVSIIIFRTAWFLQSVLSEMFIVFSLRTKYPFFVTSPSRTLVISTILATLVSFGFVYITPLADLFHMQPLDINILAVMFVVLLAYFAVTELGKKIFYSRFVD